MQHVSVNEGGRAIVGNVTQDVPGSASQKTAARPLALTDSRQQPMPIIEERRKGVLVRARRGQRNDWQAQCEEQKVRTVGCDEYVPKTTVQAG